MSWLVLGIGLLVVAVYVLSILRFGEKAREDNIAY